MSSRSSLPHGCCFRKLLSAQMRPFVRQRDRSVAGQLKAALVRALRTAYSRRQSPRPRMMPGGCRVGLPRRPRYEYSITSCSATGAHRWPICRRRLRRPRRPPAAQGRGTSGSRRSPNTERPNPPEASLRQRASRQCRAACADHDLPSWLLLCMVREAVTAQAAGGIKPALRYRVLECC